MFSHPQHPSCHSRSSLIDAPGPCLCPSASLPARNGYTMKVRSRSRRVPVSPSNTGSTTGTGSFAVLMRLLDRMAGDQDLAQIDLASFRGTSPEEQLLIDRFGQVLMQIEQKNRQMRES